METSALPNGYPMTRDQVLALTTAHRPDLHRPDLEALGVKSLELFGSVARNEATPNSDIDFLVEFNFVQQDTVRTYAAKITGATDSVGIPPAPP